MAEDQVINPTQIDPKEKRGDLNMASARKKTESDPKKQRAIILGQGFIVAGRQIIVHKITDKVRAKSKVVIEGFNLNIYDKIQLGASQNWYNPVELKKAYRESEPISFLIPNFNQNLKDGDPVFVRLISSKNSEASGFITKYLIYSAKTEEEEKQEQAKKEGQKEGKGKEGQKTSGPTGIVTDAMGQVMGGIAGAFFGNEEEKQKFEPQKISSRELAREGFSVSNEDYDTSEPVEAETVEVSEAPISGTVETSAGAQVISQETTGTTQTISQGGTVSSQGTTTISQGGTQSVSGQQTISTSGAVSGGQKVNIQGTISGQEHARTSTAASVEQQSGVSGTISTRQQAQVSGKESISQKVSGSGSASETQVAGTAPQTKGVQGETLESFENKTGELGQTRVTSGGTVGIGAQSTAGPIGGGATPRPAGPGAGQTSSFGINLGSSGTLGQGASALGQKLRSYIPSQVGQGGTLEVSSQILAAEEIGSKEKSPASEDAPQAREKISPKQESKEPVPEREEKDISYSEKEVIKKPSETEEKIEVPKEYQEMIGKLDKGDADLEREVGGEVPKEEGAPSSEPQEEGDKTSSFGGEEPEQGELGKPLEYPLKEQNPDEINEVGEGKPVRPQSSAKDGALGDKIPKIDGIQRPKDKPGLSSDFAEEMPEKSAGEPLKDAMPKAGLPASQTAAPATATEIGAANIPLAEGAAAGAAGGPMGAVAGAALAATGSKKGVDDIVGQATSPFLEQAAMWVWGLAIPSFGLSVLLGALVGDFIWMFKKKILNFRIKLHIIGMNLAVMLVVMLLVLFFAVTMKYMCMNPLTYSTIWVSGNSEICKALEATTIQTLFSEPPAPLPSNTPCAPLFSGDASVNNLTNSCFGSNAIKASAIAGAESGGIPTSESRTDRCTLDNRPVSIGLFQINISVRSINGLDCKRAFSHPFDAQHKDCRVVNEGLYYQCVQAAKNSAVNINLACQISGNGANWSAWGANKKCGF